MLPQFLKDNTVLSNKPPKACRLRWDITSKCDVGCHSCYQPDNIPRSDLPYGDCVKILHSFRDFLQRNNLTGELSFTGHPLLRSDFWDILKVAREYQKTGAIKSIAILGQASGITAETARLLYLGGVHHYSFPLGGLEPTHDAFRRPGSFRDTVAAIRTLHNAGIRCSVKFTVSRDTVNEVPEIMRLMVKEDTLINFIQSLPCGGKDMRARLLKPPEYRAVLVTVLDFLDGLSERFKSLKLSLIGAEHLFARLFYELNRRDEYRALAKVLGDSAGCGKGLRFALMPDGSVRARRFIALKLGQLPRDSFQEVYESSELVRSLDDIPYTAKKKMLFTKCRDCPVVEHCGSGIGLAYQATGNPYAPTPMCWVE